MSNIFVRDFQQYQDQNVPISETVPRFSNFTQLSDGSVGHNAAQAPFQTVFSKEIFQSTSTENPYIASEPPQDTVASAFINLTDLFTKLLITHPCNVLRRQCQVHQSARCLHITPLTLAPIVCNIVSRELQHSGSLIISWMYVGILTLWKGALGSSVLWALSTASEVLIADVFGLPRTYVKGGSRQKFWKHVSLKAYTCATMTPFIVSSFIETVRSETGLAGEDIKVMDVVTNGINRMRFDFFGSRDNSKRFTLLYLTVPTTIYHTSRYLIVVSLYDWIYAMTARYVHRKPASERKLFHKFLPQLFASMTSQVAADLICYPFETFCSNAVEVYLMHLSGTRTLIDNLDTGVSAVSITAKYTGFLDCFRSIFRREGLLALFAGVGALAFQYGMHFCFLRLLRSVIDYGSFAFSNGSAPKSKLIKATPTPNPDVFNEPLKGMDLNLRRDNFSPFTSTISPPAVAPYPTLGQSLSAFHTPSPPYIGTPLRVNTPTEMPTQQIFSSTPETLSRDPFGKLG